MSEDRRTYRSRSVSEREQEWGSRSRPERGNPRRPRRRREVTGRMWRAIIPVAGLLVIIIILLIAFGGGGGEAPAKATATSLAAEPTKGSGLLVIEQEEGVPEVLLMYPGGGGGSVLAIPGITLLQTATGFKTVAELYASGKGDDLRIAVGGALGVAVGPVATVKWVELRQAMAAAGLNDVPAVALSMEGAEAASVAQAALVFLVQVGSGPGAEAWGSLSLGGDESGFREALAANTESLPNGWTAAALTGSLVEGIGFAYLEPDVQQARTVLGGGEAGPDITVQVQNGSGATGLAETAAGMLEALGYTLLPVGNSEESPNVQRTRISAAPDTVAEAEQVQAVLGVGEITEDEGLDPGSILVVLGADFTPPSSEGTGTSD